MRIALVGRDAAPSSAFKLVQEKIKRYDGGIYIGSYLGYGKPIIASPDAICEEVVNADVLISGMSSSPDLVKEEIAAIEAASAAKVPVGLYADTFGAVKRVWFKAIRDKINFIFVVNQKEADDARGFFPKAEVIISGNPIVDQAFFPMTSRSEAREKLEIAQDERMVLSSGYKLHVVTVPTIVGIIDAAKLLLPLKLVIVLSVHPGDANYQKDKAFYDDLVAYSNTPVKIISKEKMSTSDILPGADIVVTTLSTIDQEAACQRIPVVEYFTEVAYRRMEKNFGSMTWQPCVMGIAEGVYANYQQLAQSIKKLLTPEGSDAMRKKQEEYYPAPPKNGHAVNVIAENLLRLASAQKQA